MQKRKNEQKRNKWTHYTLERLDARNRPSTATSTCLLVDHPTTSGNVVRADHERDGSTRSGRTMESPWRICGGVRWAVVTEEQRYGPRWLCDNDDEEICTRYNTQNKFIIPNFFSCTDSIRDPGLHSVTCSNCQTIYMSIWQHIIENLSGTFWDSTKMWSSETKLPSQNQPKW